jgi:hypothetical protein
MVKPTKKLSKSSKKFASMKAKKRMSQKCDDIEIMSENEKGFKIRSIRSSLNVAGAGYGFETHNSYGSCDYMTPKNITKVAEKFNMPIHLSSDWSFVGKKGYGEVVSVEEFKELLQKWVDTHPDGKFLKQHYV